MSQKINYSQCWEDSRVVLEALYVTDADTVLSITSGGDNTLALLAQKPKHLTALDFNPAQNYLAELKLCAATKLSYNQYVAFLGVVPDQNRLRTYKELRMYLSSPCQTWWDREQTAIEIGCIHCGKFEKYLNYFRRYLLPLVHTQSEIAAFIDTRTITDQQAYFTNVWNSWRWRLFFNTATSKAFLTRFARQDKMTEQSGIHTPRSYQSRLEYNLQNVPLNTNFYLHYSLRGNYTTILPTYLEKSGYAALQDVDPDTIAFVTTDILTFLRTVPDNTYSKCNLSDVFEALSPTENELVWHELVRVMQPNAIILYWNNKLKRTYPASVASSITTNETETARLQEIDRVYFYERLYVHTIIK